MANVTCPACRGELQIPDGAATGVKVNCPLCKQLFALSAPSAPMRPSALPPPPPPPPPVTESVSSVQQLEATCLNCNRRVAIDPSHVGTSLECPYCRTQFTIGGSAPLRNATPPAPLRDVRMEEEDPHRSRRDRDEDELEVSRHPRDDYDDDEDEDRPRRQRYRGGYPTTIWSAGMLWMVSGGVMLLNWIYGVILVMSIEHPKVKFAVGFDRLRPDDGGSTAILCWVCLVGFLVTVVCLMFGILTQMNRMPGILLVGAVSLVLSYTHFIEGTGTGYFVPGVIGRGMTPFAFVGSSHKTIDYNELRSQGKTIENIMAFLDVVRFGCGAALGVAGVMAISGARDLDDWQSSGGRRRRRR